MPVELRCAARRGFRFVAALRRDAVMLLELTGCESAELSLVLTTDAKIRELNRDYRGKDVSTDVLSFPQRESERSDYVKDAAGSNPPVLLGDLVISLDMAERQAQAASINVVVRLRTLLIHGLLHLLGYDHERSPAEARRQFVRERALTKRLAEIVDRGAGPGHRALTANAETCGRPMLATSLASDSSRAPHEP